MTDLCESSSTFSFVQTVHCRQINCKALGLPVQEKAGVSESPTGFAAIVLSELCDRA